MSIVGTLIFQEGYLNSQGKQMFNPLSCFNLSLVTITASENEKYTKLHLLHANYMPGTMLYIIYIFANLILMMVLQGGRNCYQHMEN